MAAEDLPSVPTHLGLILDGNRRWAKKNNLPLVEGHRKGYLVLRDVAGECFRAGVTYLSVYVFSTENWKRSEKEVAYLMKLLIVAFKKELSWLQKNDIRIRFIGRRDTLAPDILKVMANMEQTTKDLAAGTIIICLNYGGQQEIADSVKKCFDDGLSPDEITPEVIEKRLYEPDIPPVDMIVRTSGEKRLSNFMLWRAAYSELLFIEKLWPEMTKDDVTSIIEEYTNRSRRFGG